MNKDYLLSILEKYYLDGLIEKTKICFYNEKIIIDSINPNKDLIAIIEAVNISTIRKECIIGIYDSKQLIKLVNITDGELDLNLVGKNGIYKKLLINDSKVNLEYILADLNVIPNSAKLTENSFGIIFDINSSFINDFIKSKKSLDTELVTIEPLIDGDLCCIKFVIGGKKDYNHKINMSIPVNIDTVGIPGWSLNFNVSYIKEILESNKDMKEGKCFINEEGLLKFEFISDKDIKSTYFLVAKED